MSKSLKILPILFLILSTRFIYSFDSVSEYYPLQIGNSWTYYFYESGGIWGNQTSYFYKRVVTDTLRFNGHLYFKTLETDYNNIYYLRIDSLTGNLLSYSASGCGWLNNARLVDSLNSKKNDSSSADCYRGTACVDTSMISLFNYNVQSKKFYDRSYPTEKRRNYAYGFGLIYSFFLVNAGSHSGSSSSTLRGCVIDNIVYGDTTAPPIGIHQISTEIPKEHLLHQNYPNPFNPVTKIQFEVSKSAAVKLVVYDILGREEDILVNEQLKPGSYDFTWDGNIYASGVYFYQLIADDNIIETRKMVLLK